MALFTATNLAGVRHFGELEFRFAGVKGVPALDGGSGRQETPLLTCPHSIGCWTTALVGRFEGVCPAVAQGPGPGRSGAAVLTDGPWRSATAL